jgi:hypothetical protein
MNVADELETVTLPHTGGAEKNIARQTRRDRRELGPARVRHFKSAEVGTSLGEGTKGRTMDFGRTKPHGRGTNCGCRKRSLVPLHYCFRIVIYNERRNSNVSSRQRAVRRLSRIPRQCWVTRGAAWRHPRMKGPR